MERELDEANLDVDRLSAEVQDTDRLRLSILDALQLLVASVAGPIQGK